LLSVFLLLRLIYTMTLLGSKLIVSLYANDQGASTLVIGLLVSTFAFFPMFLAVKVGKWTDQYGAKKLMRIGGALTILSLCIPAAFPSIKSLFFSQMLLGFSQLFLVVSLQKTVGNMEGSRDKLISTLALMASTGGFLGPLISGFIYQYHGIQMTYMVLAILELAAWILLFIIPNTFWEQHSSDGKKQSSSSWKLLGQKELRSALIIGGLVLFSKDLFTAFFPVYASEAGLRAGTIGVLLSISAIAAMCVRLLQYPLVKKYGRKYVLLVTILLSGICFSFIPFFQSIPILAALIFLLGAGLGLGQPISLVYTLNHSPDARQGEVLGLRLTFNRLSQFSAPLVFGMIGSLTGVSIVFWFAGIVLFFGTSFTKGLQAKTDVQKE
jgi:MFS family permease